MPAEHGGPRLLRLRSAGPRCAAKCSSNEEAGQSRPRRASTHRSACRSAGRETFRAETAIGECELHADLSLASAPVPSGRAPASVSPWAATTACRSAASRCPARSIATGRRRSSPSTTAGWRWTAPRSTTSSARCCRGRRRAWSSASASASRPSGGLFTTGDLPLASAVRSSRPARRVPARGVAARFGADARAAPSSSRPPLPVASTDMQGGGIPHADPDGQEHRPGAPASRAAQSRPGHERRLAEDADRGRGFVQRPDRAGRWPASIASASSSPSIFPTIASKANLHFANLDVGFLPPAGIGLAVDAEERQGRGLPVPRRSEAAVRRGDGAQPLRRDRPQGDRPALHPAAGRQQGLLPADPGHGAVRPARRRRCCELPMRLAPDRHRRA